MKGKKSSSIFTLFNITSRLILILFSAVSVIKAQSAPVDVQPSSTAQSNPSPIQPAPVFGPSLEDIQRRIERGRALAAAHQLETAASELEAARSATSDIALRDGTSVMLMGIYLEAGNYSRAQSLLEETFHTRYANKDSSIRTYFALAGQAINGVRSHLARYRNFGVSLSSSSLPTEAANDLDRARILLERMLAQGKEITKDPQRANDGLALMEDVLGIRLSLARDSEDRERWQAEYAQAREQLGSGRMEIASLGTPSLGRSQQVTTQSAPSQPVDTARASVAAPQGPASTSPPTMEAGSLNQRANKRVVPTYPQLAKAARASGTVKVHVIVTETGDVQVTRSEGPPLLCQAAEEAARAWRFVPAVVDGKPVRMSGYIEFNFGL